MVTACHMVRNKIDDNIHSHIMRACHKAFKFLYSIRHIFCNVRVNIVIVLNGIRGTGKTFYNMRVIFWNSIFGIVAAVGMLKDTSVPNMSNAKFLDGRKNITIDVIELSRAVSCK